MTKTKTKILSYHTIGCRLNQYETEKMAAALYPYGFRRANPGEKADLYLINTCTVTHRADQSSRNIISRANRENPNGKIVVAGCYVDRDPEQIAAMLGVDVIVNNAQKDFITEILPRELPDLFTGEPDYHLQVELSEFCGHNRAWLKVSDGCNQSCAYCILPRVRGKLRNRPTDGIINEVTKLVGSGFHEIVMTGLNMGYYNDTLHTPMIKNLAGLCREIFDQTELSRLRLSSIEPQTVNDDLINVCAEQGERMCRYWHLSLQSGSSRVLKLMKRPYTREKFIGICEKIKSTIPNTVIGADVIVGFPGETDDDFNESRTLTESGLLDYLHVFSYSDRPGTTAADMPDKVHPETIKERNAILTEISDTNREKANQRQVGETLGVIAEHKKRGENWYWAISDNYLRVKMPESFAGGKQIVKVKITSANEMYIDGKLV